MKKPSPTGVKKLRLAKLTTLGDLQPRSFDEKAGTVDVVLASGDRFSWYDPRLHDGPIYMVLGLEPGEVRLERLNSGRLNLLNNHGEGSLSPTWGPSYVVSNILGSFREGSARFAEVDGRRALVATAHLSQRDELAGLRQDIQAGDVRQVSPGIRIYAAKPEGPLPLDGSPPTWRATDWEPREVSLTAVPAQANSYLLNEHDSNECEVTLHSEPLGADMKTPEQLAAEKAAADAALKSTDTTTGGAATAVLEPVKANLSDAEKAAERAAEQSRVLEIQTLSDKCKLPVEVARDLITRNVSLAAAREVIMDKWSKAVGDQTPAAARALTEVSDANLKAENDAMMDALVHRGNTNLLPVSKLSEQARKFATYTLSDMAAELLERSGTRTRGRGRDELIRLSLHASSDFPLLLAGSANKTLRAQYDITPRTWQSWARRGVLTDFKSTSRVQLGGAPALEEVPETGAIPRGTLGEQAESIKLKSWGKVVALSRQAMVNDDLSAFLRIPQLFGQSAATTEDDLAYGILTANAAMADTQALFLGQTTGHKNLVAAGGGSALSIAGLAAAQALMRLQTGLDGKYLNLEPRYVIVPAALEVAAKQLLVQTQTTVVTTVTTGVNVFLDRLIPVVQPRLDATSTTVWYMTCDPSFCDTVEIGFLAGQDGPRIETNLDFNTDGLEIKCMHDVCAKAIDWRGMVKSPGA